MTEYPIMIVGEHWDQDDAEAREAFAGKTGRFLYWLLRSAGIPKEKCFFTNVINKFPPANEIKYFCGPKETGIGGLPSVIKGAQGYLQLEHKHELLRLQNEIRMVKPNVVIALGAVSLWALCKTTGLMNVRGTTTQGFNDVKVLPTFKPLSVIRDYKQRPVMVADLNKALRESAFPDIRRPSREIWIEPTLADMEEFYVKYILPATDLSTDIETVANEITCVGFAPSIDRALVIPFHDKRRDLNNFLGIPI